VRRIARIGVVTLLAVQLAACGTLLYPERRGQTSGRYDADVVLLDAAGLLLFIVPGVIAFAVDILTGAIYLPPGEESHVVKRLGRVDTIHLDPARRSPAWMAGLLERETGLEIGRIRLHRDETACSAAAACLARYAAWTDPGRRAALARVGSR
jgi:hypothetical protein